MKFNLKKLGLFGLLAFAVLPTGTPEDLVTTVPLIAYFGLEVYLVLATVLLFLAWDKLKYIKI